MTLRPGNAEPDISESIFVYPAKNGSEASLTASRLLAEHSRTESNTSTNTSGPAEYSTRISRTQDHCSAATMLTSGLPSGQMRRSSRARTPTAKPSNTNRRRPRHIENIGRQTRATQRKEFQWSQRPCWMLHRCQRAHRRPTVDREHCDDRGETAAHRPSRNKDRHCAMTRNADLKRPLDWSTIRHRNSYNARKQSDFKTSMVEPLCHGRQPKAPWPS